jgi:hypothetical protein
VRSSNFLLPVVYPRTPCFVPRFDPSPNEGGGCGGAAGTSATTVSSATAVTDRSCFLCTSFTAALLSHPPLPSSFPSSLPSSFPSSLPSSFPSSLPLVSCLTHSFPTPRSASRGLFNDNDRSFKFLHARCASSESPPSIMKSMSSTSATPMMVCSSNPSTPAHTFATARSSSESTWRPLRSAVLLRCCCCCCCCSASARARRSIFPVGVRGIPLL